MSDDIQNIKIRLVGETDFSQVDQGIQKLSQSEQKLVAQFKEVDNQAKVANKSIQDETAKSNKAVGESSKSFDGLIGKVKGLSSQIPGAFAVEEVLSFGKATTGAVSSVGGLSSTMGVLKVAIASTGIGALVIALGSLIAYFTRADDGATRLEGILGGLGAIFSEVAGFVAEFGGRVFDAFSSVENFGQALSDLGETIVNNVINRFTSVIVLGEAIALLFEGKFSEAAKKATDAQIQFTLGIENGTDKMNAFGERVAAAAKQAYDFALKMDAISDAQRELNVELAKNEQQVTNLIIQAKNRTLSEQQRISLFKEANQIEEAGLNKQLDLENQRLVLIQERNAREQAAINQRLNQSIAEAKTEEEKIRLRQKSLSINDDLAQEEADQRKKIIDLQTASLNLQERNQNRIDVLVEQSQQKELAALKRKITEAENIEKQRYVDREIGEKELVDNIATIQIKGLQNERTLLIKYGKDVTDINKSIEDILIKQRQDADKKAEQDLKESIQRKQQLDEDVMKAGLQSLKFYQTEQENLEKQRFLKGEINEETYQKELQAIQIDVLNKTKDFLIQEGKDVTEIDKQILDAQLKQKQDAYNKDVKAKKDAEDKKKAIEQQAVTLATTLYNGFFQLQQQNYATDLQNLETAKNQELASVGDNKQAQAVINAKFAKQENDIKRKQAQTDKEAAIFGIVINTALAIVKQLGATPLPAGAPLVALIAATGAAQLAFAASKPIPKFNRGTKSVPGVDTGGDSVLAMLRPGEGVMPVDKMAKYRPAFEAMFDDRVPAGLINSVAMDYDRLGRMIPTSNYDSGVGELKNELKAMNRKLDKLQSVNIEMNEKGFKKYLQIDGSITEIHNNYARLRKL